MDELIYDSYLDAALRAEIDLVSAPIKVLLTTADYMPDESDSSLADVRYEVNGSPGYRMGGQLLQDRVVEGGVFRAADAVWPNSTITASRAVVYQSGPTPAQSPLILCVTFDEESSSRNSEFRLHWSEEGILDLRRGFN